LNVSTTTRCIVSINSVNILTYTPPRTTTATWTKLSVQYTATAGTYPLKFLNNTTDSTDSSFLITGIYMTVL
jgi:hypothetical protein